MCVFILIVAHEDDQTTSKTITLLAIVNNNDQDGISFSTSLHIANILNRPPHLRPLSQVCCCTLVDRRQLISATSQASMRHSANAPLLLCVKIEQKAYAHAVACGTFTLALMMQPHNIASNQPEYCTVLYTHTLLIQC